MAVYCLLPFLCKNPWRTVEKMGTGYRWFPLGTAVLGGMQNLFQFVGFFAEFFLGYSTIKTSGSLLVKSGKS